MNTNEGHGMLGKNGAILWVIEHPESKRFVAFLVTDEDYAIGNGVIGAITQATWRSHAIADTPDWRGSAARLTEFWEKEGYEMILEPQEVKVSISHHRDLTTAREVTMSSSALSFTVSLNLQHRIWPMPELKV